MTVGLQVFYVVEVLLTFTATLAVGLNFGKRRGWRVGLTYGCIALLACGIFFGLICMIVFPDFQ
jgi:hypothetical protein